jgi:hypothetical protein
MRHKAGRAYCHIPSGKKVWISQYYNGNMYNVHCNFSGTFAFNCTHDELRLWDYSDEVRKHDVVLKNMPCVTFNNFINAASFAVQNHGQLTTKSL